MTIQNIYINLKWLSAVAYKLSIACAQEFIFVSQSHGASRWGGTGGRGILSRSYAIWIWNRIKRTNGVDCWQLWPFVGELGLSCFTGLTVSIGTFCALCHMEIECGSQNQVFHLADCFEQGCYRRTWERGVYISQRKSISVLFA